MLSKYSLTRTTLIKMGVRIALVIIAVTLLSYWHLMWVLQAQTQEQLSKYITERGLRESNLFILAESNQALLKQELLFRLAQLGRQDLQAEFDRLFVKGTDGVIRNRPELFDGTRQPGVFLGKNVTLTPDIRQRVVTYYELARTYGAAWQNRFLNTYLMLPENGSIFYWPSAPTLFQDVPADYSIPDEEFFWVADQQHNPTRTTAWTGTYYDPNAKVWMVSGETPVDRDNIHIATLGHDIVLTELFQRTMDEHLQGTYNFIFREDGRLIVHPRYLDSVAQYIAQTDDPHLRRIFQLIKDKSAETVVVDNATDAEYLAVTRLQGPNWYFVTVYPKSLLSTLAFQTARFILFLGILSLFGEIFILFLVLRQQVAQPLRTFQAATEQLANGDFTVQLDTSRQDELGRLAHSFHTMTRELQLREAKLADSNQQLLLEIEERKQIEEALLEAKDHAEAANRAKSVFLANMSHELRTPLNGILGYAQILGYDSDLTTQQREGITVIQQSGNYLLSLINDVLDLSKIESGRLELYPTEFDLLALLHNLCDLFQIRARQKGLSFVFEMESDLSLGLSGDNKRLRQILINLLGNAVKFTQRGGIIFQVSYAEGALHCKILDTGIGIAPEDLAKIFLPFQQAGDPHYRPEGTGLGLSITHKLVELMGGELHVESQLGQGSCFGVSLKMPKCTWLQSKQEEKSIIVGFQIPSHSPLHDKGEVLILVIDDHRENRSVLVHLLTPLGFKVVEASHGQAGLEMARRYSPALVISDLVMPIMDGFEFARQLRQLPEFQTIPMIAATASVFDLNSPESLTAGYNEVIAKPLQAEQLYELLQKYLNLTWSYKQLKPQVTDGVLMTSEIDNTAPLPQGPGQEQVAVLLELALMGDMNGILDELEKLERQDPNSLPFVTEIRQLALDFDDIRICEMIQSYI